MVPENIEKLKQQIAALEYLLTHDTSNKDKAIYQKALNNLREEVKQIILRGDRAMDKGFILGLLEQEKARLVRLLEFSGGVEHSATLDVKRNIKRYEKMLAEEAV